MSVFVYRVPKPNLARGATLNQASLEGELSEIKVFDCAGREF
jgi:hypothetical protein